ncbi:hypothetical protein CNECB9_1150013 [Cupriavidus necator]|uniref:Uncharacterized protein n=1 Tax=Cupriavidus necator TaxID=106590 RepID=A0A1K0I889_CUPNE|nr:hypothetical protein CNECB9_1150013 [Cupriavidus necator]
MTDQNKQPAEREAFQRWWDGSFGQVLELTGDEEADASCRIAKAAASQAWSAALSHPAGEAQPDTVPDTSQDWAKLGGAVAYHLIERHGEDWADIGRKMDAWGAARFAGPPSSDTGAQPAVIREAIEGAFEEREGWRMKIAAAVRALDAPPQAAPVAQALTDETRKALLLLAGRIEGAEEGLSPSVSTLQLRSAPSSPKPPRAPARNRPAKHGMTHSMRNGRAPGSRGLMMNRRIDASTSG